MMDCVRIELDGQHFFAGACTNCLWGGQAKRSSFWMFFMRLVSCVRFRAAVQCLLRVPLALPFPVSLFRLRRKTYRKTASINQQDPNIILVVLILDDWAGAPRGFVSRVATMEAMLRKPGENLGIKTRSSTSSYSNL